MGLLLTIALPAYVLVPNRVVAAALVKPAQPRCVLRAMRNERKGHKTRYQQGLLEYVSFRAVFEKLLEEAVFFAL